MSALSDAKKALEEAQATVDEIEAAEKREKFETIGGFLELLKEIIGTDAAWLPLFAEGRWIGNFGSWRGSYDQAAIGSGWDGSLSAIGLRNRIVGALEADEVFTGYKGGDYTFSASTPLRIDNYGEYTGTKSVEGFRVLDDRVELLVWDADA